MVNAVVSNEVIANAFAFERVLSALVRSIEGALAEYNRMPRPGMEYASKKWQETALRLLTADLQTTRDFLSNTSDVNRLQALLAAGESETGLAKKLDSFRFDFAGDAFEKILNSDVDATVHAASEVVKALAGKL